MRKNILFDLDGTLTDPSVGITTCIEYALEKLKVPCPPRQSLTKYIGPPLWQSFAELLGTTDREAADEALAIYRERFSTIGLFENTPYDGISEALENIRSSGYELFVCTSKPQVFAERIVEKFELRRFFNKVYGSSLDGTHVEKDGLIAHLISSEGLDKNCTVMIGDRIYDIAGAKANGIRGYGVSYGFGEFSEFAGAETVFSSPGEIASYFAVQNPSAPENGRE
jgi:phosphoglycolate phosphatase